MHYHITQQLDCITRGGMCMPFYLTAAETKRLSIDIDFLTPQTINKIRNTMSNLNDGAYNVRCEEYIPLNPHPVDNLITYKVYYNSCLEKRQSFVKVDFLCDVNIPITSQIIKPGFQLLGFDTLQNITILSKGTLLADKITTMALGTIGLNKNREIAKQIYDLGKLLKNVTTSDLRISFDMFENMTYFKTKHYEHEPTYNISDVSQNIVQSVSNFLELKSAVTITNNQEKRYKDFLGTYVAKKSRYKKTDHITDILLVNLYSQYLYRYINETITQTQATNSLSKIVAQVNKIENNTIDNMQKTKKSYMQSIPDSVNYKKKILNGTNFMHIYLMHELGKFS